MSKSGPSKSRAKVVKMLHRVSLLPTSAFTLFRSPKPSLDIINTSLSASSSRRWDSFSSLLSPIITLIFRRLHLKLLRCLHQPVVPLLYFPFGALGKRMVHQMGEEAKVAGLPCGCKADPDTRDAPTAERDKQLTKQESQWASCNGRYQGFEDLRWEVVPYRKGMNLR